MTDSDNEKDMGQYTKSIKRNIIIMWRSGEARHKVVLGVRTKHFHSSRQNCRLEPRSINSHTRLIYGVIVAWCQIRLRDKKPSCR